MINILIVEDNPNMLQKLDETLRESNPDIKTFTSPYGKEALLIANRVAIDIFIIDIQLPDITGVLLSQELRKKYRHSPIIIETSIKDLQFESKIHNKIHNLAFLKKPFSTREILECVEYAMEAIDKSERSVLMLKKTGTSVVFPLNRILYIERMKNSKQVRVVSLNYNNKQIDENIFNGYSLRRLLNHINDNSKLCRCHYSFIVNPNIIKLFDTESKVLHLRHTDDKIPYSKTYKSNWKYMEQGGGVDCAVSS